MRCRGARRWQRNPSAALQRATARLRQRLLHVAQAVEVQVGVGAVPAGRGDRQAGKQARRQRSRCLTSAAMERDAASLCAACA